jgi:hypothetical protein
MHVSLAAEDPAKAQALRAGVLRTEGGGVCTENA